MSNSKAQSLIHSQEIIHIKIYKMCHDSRYSNDMRMYFSNDVETTTGNIMVTHFIVRNLSHVVKG